MGIESISCRLHRIDFIDLQVKSRLYLVKEIFQVIRIFHNLRMNFFKKALEEGRSLPALAETSYSKLIFSKEICFSDNHLRYTIQRHSIIHSPSFA